MSFTLILGWRVRCTLLCLEPLLLTSCYASTCVTALYYHDATALNSIILPPSSYHLFFPPAPHVSFTPQSYTAPPTPLIPTINDELQASAILIPSAHLDLVDLSLITSIWEGGEVAGAG